MWDIQSRPNSPAGVAGRTREPGADLVRSRGARRSLLQHPVPVQQPQHLRVPGLAFVFAVFSVFSSKCNCVNASILARVTVFMRHF